MMSCLSMEERDEMTDFWGLSAIELHTQTAIHAVTWVALCERYLAANSPALTGDRPGSTAAPGARARWRHVLRAEVQRGHEHDEYDGGFLHGATHLNHMS